MAALLPQPDTLELLTPLLVAASVAVVAIVIGRVSALTRSMRTQHENAKSAPSDTVADFPLNPLEERTTRPWNAPCERDAIPARIERVSTSANTAPIGLDSTGAHSR